MSTPIDTNPELLTVIATMRAKGHALRPICSHRPSPAAHISHHYPSTVGTHRFVVEACRRAPVGVAIVGCHLAQPAHRFVSLGVQMGKPTDIPGHERLRGGPGLDECVLRLARGGPLRPTPDELDKAYLVNDPRPPGVIGSVSPWNVSLLMAAGEIAPALACGNTAPLKPRRDHSADRAGTRRDLGHDDLDKVAFTGSTEVGKQIQATLDDTKRRLTLELGGKAAAVVFDDAPLDQAVEGVVDGSSANAGQDCCAGSRLLVAEPIAEQVLELPRARIATLRVGDPLDQNTDVGAINSRGPSVASPTR